MMVHDTAAQYQVGFKEYARDFLAFMQQSDEPYAQDWGLIFLSECLNS